MKDKEKQIIEEMIKDLVPLIYKKEFVNEILQKPLDYFYDSCDDEMEICEELVRLGYRKLPENSIIINRSRTKGKSDGIVLLTREEYQKNILKANSDGYGAGKIGGSKETAEKSINDIFKICKQRFNDTKGYTCWGDIEFVIQKYAEQVGVKIKE